MKHNLEAINAAIRLGDNQFVPPLGAICRIWLEDYYDEPQTVVVKRWSTTKYFACRSSGHDFWLADIDPPGAKDWRIMEVIMVPDEATPFGDWERCK